MRAREPEVWTVRARNLPEHAGNAIHTDAGARAAGFPRALVAGVTTYAYLTHPLAAAWGADWLQAGSSEVRFHSPVYDDDEVVCTPRRDDDEVIVDALCGDAPEPRATVRARWRGGVRTAMTPGEPLPTLQAQLVGEWADYGWRAGDDLPLYRDEGIVHPAVWPALANRVVGAELARGPWIHTRSAVRHHSVARVGEQADVRAAVVRRVVRRGERAVLDVHIDVGGRPVATVEHEAIIALA